MDSTSSSEVQEACESLYDRLYSYWVEREAYAKIATLEHVDEAIDRPVEEEEEIQLALAALDDTPPQVRDPIEQVNIGTDDDPLIISISAKLSEVEREELLSLLREYKDCFASKYEDMPGLSSDLVCHSLPTFPNSKLVKQDG